MLDNSRMVNILPLLWITNYRHQLKEFTDVIREMKPHQESLKKKKKIWFFNIFVCKTEPPCAGKLRGICIKNSKYDILLLSEPEPFTSNQQHLLLSIFTS